jgi:hypothetical protein
VSLGTSDVVDTRANPVKPTEHERHVADVLRTEGWAARVTPPNGDFGLDIICERPGRRLGVQVKMYGEGRPVSAQMIMKLHGAAAYRDCGEMMIATRACVGRRRRVADKLGVEIRHVPVPTPGIRRVTPEPGGDLQSANAEGRPDVDAADATRRRRRPTLERSSRRLGGWPTLQLDRYALAGRGCGRRGDHLLHGARVPRPGHYEAGMKGFVDYG